MTKVNHLQGDLLCETCTETASCPACSIKLAPGTLARNKVLENIARKYFAGK